MHTSNDRILRIGFTEPGQDRIRNIVTRSRSIVTTISWSVKSDCHVDRQVHGEGHESVILEDLECDPMYRTYRDQPCRIFYVLNGIEQEHIPDVLAIPHVGLEELIEIKLRRFVTAEVDARTALMTRCLPALGFRYSLRIVEDYKKEPQRSNRSILIHFSGRPVTLYERELITQTCENEGGVMWMDAFNGRFGRFGREILCRLFIEGVLSFDLATPLVANTRFYLRNGGR